ncbi:hypothetical protein SAMN04490244_103176 [Tranquillimonas rosea]|uniref:Uncharacterized protein n=1 Tax=Tranquillimonas rosea TaxID=641238 RepID=A0A1H9SGS3_9RHOB|nr:hypothetical protein [Tranquillimonas rosea]SER83593.1 hypothetical protein SAMN04490244_103176 [Tranquillimonas rosea]
MSFVRPQVRALMWRWREALAGGGAILLGLWWALVTGGLMLWIGIVVVLGGVALAVSGIQRGRFRRGGGGPGVVQLVEGQLGYFGPLTGGVVATDDITFLGLTALPGGRAQWDVVGGDGTNLSIPTDAEGAEAMLDVIARFPDLRTEDVLSRLSKSPVQGGTVWRKDRPRLH